jgi:hypothetical protein
VGVGVSFQQRRWKPAERRHPTGREGMRSAADTSRPKTQYFLRKTWVCFLGGAFRVACSCSINYRCKHPEILQKSGRLRAPSTILSSSSSLAHPSPSPPQPHPPSTPQLLEAPSCSFLPLPGAVHGEADGARRDAQGEGAFFGAQGGRGGRRAEPAAGAGPVRREQGAAAGLTTASPRGRG